MVATNYRIKSMQIIALNDSGRQDTQFERLPHKVFDYLPTNCYFFLLRPASGQVNRQFFNHIEKYLSKFTMVFVYRGYVRLLFVVLLFEQCVQLFLLPHFVGYHFILHLLASQLQTGDLFQKLLLCLLFLNLQPLFWWVLICRDEL